MSSSSSASSSGSNSITEREAREQAGPLPVKVGELGYTSEASTTSIDPSASTVTLSGPHPAERQTQDIERDLPPTNTSASSAAASTETLASTTSTMNSISKFKHTLRAKFPFLTPSPKSKSYLLGGTPRTVLRLCFQLFILGATIITWIFSVRRVQVPPPAEMNSDNFLATGAVFIHVAFTVVTLVQLLFIERRVYRLRVERYMYLHPNSVLPFHRFGITEGSGSRPNIPFAPWHRQPLPTYAAALGFRGTGDVEDNEIARVVAMGRGDVPPIYGNTRGSTLLAYGLGGPPRNTSQRASNGSPSRSPTRPTSLAPTLERPVSYGRSEELEDASRALKLERTLAKLEAGGRGSSPGHL